MRMTKSEQIQLLERQVVILSEEVTILRTRLAHYSSAHLGSGAVLYQEKRWTG